MRSPARFSASFLVAISFAALSVAGCASRASVEPGPEMSCEELNASISATSKDISGYAVSRGKVAEFSLPGWLSGASRAQDAMAERNTRKIEELQQRLDRLTAEYRRRCPSN
ncbi:MAG: hypothetical protein WBF87_12790 [Mesorhizobium sp.]